MRGGLGANVIFIFNDTLEGQFKDSLEGPGAAVGQGRLWARTIRHRTHDITVELARAAPMALCAWCRNKAVQSFGVRPGPVSLPPSLPNSLSLTLPPSLSLCLTLSSLCPHPSRASLPFLQA